jgi:hypothetical protein
MRTDGPVSARGLIFNTQNVEQLKSGGYLLNVNPFTTAFQSSTGSATVNLPPGISYVDETVPLVVTNLGEMLDDSLGVVYALIDIRYSFDANNSRPNVVLSGPTECSLYQIVTYTVAWSDPDADAQPTIVWYRGGQRVDMSTNNTNMAFNMTKFGVDVILVHVFDRRGAMATASVRVLVGNISEIASTGGAFSGRLVDSVTGTGLSGIRLYSGPTATFFTNDTGHFHLSPRGSGSYDLRSQISDCLSITPSSISKAFSEIIKEGFQIACSRISKVSIEAASAEITNGTSSWFTLTRSGGVISASLSASIICAHGNSAVRVNASALSQGDRRFQFTFAASQSVFMIPIQHMRATGSDPRNLIVTCRVDDQAGFLPARPAVASIRLLGTLQPPNNDDFSNATTLDEFNMSASGFLGAASTQLNEPFGSRSERPATGGFLYACPSVWFRWTAPMDGILSVNSSISADV